MNRFERLLAGNDLRSIGKNKEVILKVKTQADFDELFEYLFHKERNIVMRAADAIEKISANEATYLIGHENQLLKLCESAINKELQWHLALLIPRLILSGDGLKRAWTVLVNWANHKDYSKIVRVNSLQALFEIACKKTEFQKQFISILKKIEAENIPSISARIKKLKNEKPTFL